MKFSEAIQGYILYISAGDYSIVTVQNYRRTLRIICEQWGDPELETITTNQIREFLASLRLAGKASATVQAYWKTIRTFYNWASKTLEIKRPDDDIPAPLCQNKAIIPFTEDEIKAMLKACEYTDSAATENRKTYKMRRPTAKRDKALLLLLLDTGARVGEISRLVRNDLDLENGAVTIRPFQTGRKSRGRQVFLGETAKRAMWLYLATRGQVEKNAPLFTTELTNRSLERDAIKKLCTRLGERTRIPNVHPHRFRHTFAIQYLRNGGDVFTLQRLLGHSSLHTVLRYLSLADSDAAAAHRRSSPADNWKL